MVPAIVLMASMLRRTLVRRCKCHHFIGYKNIRLFLLMRTWLQDAKTVSKANSYNIV